MRDEHLEDAVSSICLAQSGSPVLLTGTLVKTPLISLLVPAGLMGPNGSLRLDVLASRTNNANAITLSAEFGGHVLGNFNVINTQQYRLQFSVWNRGSEVQQVAGTASASFGPGVATTGGVMLPAIDTRLPVVVTISGTLVNIADALTLEAFRLELFR